MIRRRFLALAFAAIVTMHVPRLGWFEGEAEPVPVEDGMGDYYAQFIAAVARNRGIEWRDTARAVRRA